MYTILFVIEGADGPMTCSVETEALPSNVFDVLREEQPSVDVGQVTESFVFEGQIVEHVVHEDETCDRCGGPLKTFMQDTDGTNLEERHGCPNCDS